MGWLDRFVNRDEYRRIEQENIQAEMEHVEQLAEIDMLALEGEDYNKATEVHNRYVRAVSRLHSAGYTMDLDGNWRKR